jgi:hypothetical protein
MGVTRRKDEVFHEDYIVERRTRKIGWMFSGSFHGTIKGPIIFWEKEWGTINAQSYIQHIVPLITEYIHSYPCLQLVQDMVLNLLFKNLRRMGFI